MRYRDSDGRSRRESFALKADALDKQRRIKNAKYRGEVVDPDLRRTKLGEVAEAWYETTADLKEKTRHGYRSILDAHINPALGDRPIGSIQSVDVEAFLASLDISIGTQRNVLRVLNQVMDRAVRDNMIRANPGKGIKLRTNGARREMQFLTADQVAELAEEVGPEYSTLVYFAAYTGMRAGEIVALRVKHVDLMRRRVTVRESVSEVAGRMVPGTTKNSKQRTIGLPSFLADLLMEQTAGKERTAFVFMGGRGAQLRHSHFYQRNFRPAVERLVKRGDWPEDLRGLRAHDLRHTCASLLIHKGIHPKAISDHLGHSSIAITMDRYGHLYPDAHDAIGKALNAIYEEAPKQVSGAVVAVR